MPVHAKKAAVVYIESPNLGQTDVALVGTTPFISNPIGRKGMKELIGPGESRRNPAAKKHTLKHNPFLEFQCSIYRLGEGAPTLAAFKAAAVKGAAVTAAVDVPGTTAAQIRRLLYVPEGLVPLYGLPMIYTTMVRDARGTPDVRTRAIFPEWAIVVTVKYLKHLMNETSIFNLLETAGITVGIGDGRVEKGKCAFGAFRVATPDDPEVQRLMAEGGREAQIAAMRQMAPYDRTTRELLTWFVGEMARRGIDLPEITDDIILTGEVPDEDAHHETVRRAGFVWEPPAEAA